MQNELDRRYEVTASSTTAPSSPVPPNTPPTGSTPWRNAVLAVFALCGFATASWVSRIPAVRDNLDLTTADVGLLLFGGAAGAIFGLTLAPWFQRLLGARRGILYGLLGMAVATVLLGLAAESNSTFALATAALVGQSFAFSITDVIMNVEGAQLERSIRKTLMPMLHAFFSLGTIAGALVGAGAAATGVSVSVHLAAVGALVALASFYSVRFIPRLPTVEEVPRPKQTGPERLAQQLRLLRDPRLAFIGLLVVGMTLTEGAANDWIALGAVDGHGLPQEVGALVFGAFVTAMTIGRMLGGPLIDRFGRAKSLIGLALLGLSGLLLFILAENTWLVVLGALLWGLGGSLGFPIGVTLAADHPTHAAERVSTVAICGYFAFLVGPPALGILGEHWGVLNALYIVAGLLMLSLLAIPRAARPARERHADS
ncbi:fucose permease [Zhihengliuella halotolerans]|uniref:Fucose permease n=1 Tax=Zhihengliuella halotolerans TaxID=370736 RepID=A0A4Q8ACF4_9MICC|nr:fucose permease [Zhihengliuella halotolerans]